jgi:Leucine-rich repeat (LRR) protein
MLSNKSPCECLVQLLTFCYISFALGLLFSTPARVLLQSDACERKVGTCVWAGAMPHGIFPNGLFGAGGCAVDKVRTVDARMCYLSKLHASVADMSSLEVIDLRANLFEEFPPPLLSPKLVKLRSVDLSNNQLREFLSDPIRPTVAPTVAPTTELSFLNSPTVSPTIPGSSASGAPVYVPPSDLLRSSLGWLQRLYLANNYLKTLPVELAYVARGGAYMQGGNGAWVKGTVGGLSELSLDNNPDLEVLKWGDLQQRMDARRTAITSAQVGMDARTASEAAAAEPPSPAAPTHAPTVENKQRMLTKLSPVLFSQLPNLRHLDLSTHGIGHGADRSGGEDEGVDSLDALFSQLSDWCPSLRVLDLRGNLADQYTSAGLSVNPLASTKVSAALGDGTARLQLLRLVDLTGAASSPYDTIGLGVEGLLGSGMQCALGDGNAACCKNGATIKYLQPPQEIEFTSSGCYYGPRTND